LEIIFDRGIKKLKPRPNSILPATEPYILAGRTIINMESIFGVDFDGTICDTAALKSEYLKANWGFSVNPWEANRTTLTEKLGVLSQSSYDLMLETVCSRECTLSAKPLEGAYRSLKRLSEAGPVYVVTGRSGVWLSAAVEWMHNGGMDDFVEGYVSSKLCRPKVGICERLNMTHLVEDDPGSFSDMTGKITGVLLQNGYKGAHTPDNGVKHARNWDEALEYLL
jgi:hypothetical protein